MAGVVQPIRMGSGVVTDATVNGLARVNPVEVSARGFLTDLHTATGKYQWQPWLDDWDYGTWLFFYVIGHEAKSVFATVERIRLDLDYRYAVTATNRRTINLHLRYDGATAMTLFEMPEGRNYHQRIDFTSSDPVTGTELPIGVPPSEILSWESALLADPSRRLVYSDWCEEKGWYERAKELRG